jgi:tetratricopeptide (TPR) repeat protein
MGQIEDLVQLAAQCHQAGRLFEAETLYRKVLSVAPSNPDALHLLGVLAAQVGNIQEGIRLIRVSLSHHPRFVEALANLGRLLVDAGELNESAATYRRALQIRPGDGTLLLCLGMVLRKLRHDAEALEVLQRSIVASPQMPEVHMELGACLKSLRRNDEAVTVYKQAIAIWPNLAGAFNNLGNLLLAMERSDEAVRFLRRAVELEPENLVFHANLGDALCQVEEFAPALKHFDFVLDRDPRSVQALKGKGIALAELQRFDEAISLQRRAIELSPNDPLLWGALGDTYFSGHDPNQAEEAFKSALAIRPEDPKLWMGLGMAHRALGRFDRAEECYRKALSIDSSHVPAHKALAMIGELAQAAEIERFTAILSSPQTPEDQSIMAHFAVAKLHDDAGRYDEAFEHYSHANRKNKEKRARSGDKFVPGALGRKLDQIEQIFTTEFFASRSDWGNHSEAPVFIVGMPRSGTTLIEQILASHSKVFGAGELKEIHTAAGRLSYPDAAASWEKLRISEAAAAHVEFLRRKGGDARFVVDKLPGNIINLGLIATLFPKARVIYSQRDPLDNCLSCHFQQFSAAGLTFTYDLKHCAEQYLGQQRLRQHWMKVLPLQSMNVQYEELVADLEGQSRRLIDFLGLEWEPQCLEFYKTERPVFTASVWQVRQPLYNSSVGRWKHYRKHLGPLFEALGMPPDGGE